MLSRASFSSLALVALLAVPAAAQDTVTAATEAAAPSTAAVAAPAAPAVAVPAANEAPAADTAELQRRIDVLAGEIEALKLGEGVVTAEESVYGMGPAASKVYRSKPGLSIGGYGEVVYENYAAKLDNEARSGKTDKIDFLRNILYVGYKFNDKWVLNTEIEFEHVKEVFVEFAYVDYLMRPELNFRGGLMLAPVGLVNELHEPTIFLPAKRSLTESNIIPTTWREIGAGVFGEIAGVSYKLYLMDGLNAIGKDDTGAPVPNYTNKGIRSGRQKGAEAKAEDWGLAARVDYTGLPGLLVGVSAYQDQADQTKDKKLEVGTRIVDAHLHWKWKGLTLRGLVAQTTILEAEQYNKNFGLTGKKSVGEKMLGYYVESGYDVLSLLDGFEAAITPYLRYEVTDTHAAVPAGGKIDDGIKTTVATFGLSVQPIDQIVIKGDYQNFSSKNHKTADQVNVALGYLF